MSKQNLPNLNRSSDDEPEELHVEIPEDLVRVYHSFEDILIQIKDNVEAAYDDELLEALHIIQAEIMRRAREREKRLVMDILDVLNNIINMATKGMTSCNSDECCRMHFLGIIALSNKAVDALTALISNNNNS